ncbi:alpha/beta-hydrolase [Paramyrothecium foliicola]|nr:alpha/beta-hydrolase [Paramyrothecium foliicola]
MLGAITRSTSLAFVSLAAAAFVVGSATHDCAGVNAIHPLCRSSETPYTRDSFYVGGRYIETATGNVTVDQVYVEKIVPIHPRGNRTPLVFFHGGGTSAVSWLNTPDNRKGWASYFIAKGHPVYLVDAYSGARSAANDFSSYVFASGISAEGAQGGFTKYSEKHTQWPGTGLAHNSDPAFEAFVKTLIPWTTSFEAQELAMRSSGCQLLSLITSAKDGEGQNKALLISHSLGSFYPILLSNDCPELIKGSINLEPATIPFWRYNLGRPGGVPQSPWGLTFSRLSYQPQLENASGLVTEIIGEDTVERRECHQQREPARTLPNVSSVPYLAISGEASYFNAHGHCIMNYLRQVGGAPEWIKLADVGIKGNGHFMHVELNNLKIAKLVENWFSRL